MSTPKEFRSGDVLVTDDTVSTLDSYLARLGQGVSRTVYALGEDHVLKVDRPDGGKSWAGGCADELSVWENADTLIRDYLAPIVAAGDGWLVMERCDLAGCYVDTDELEDALREWTGDLHIDNVGRRRTDGELVALDYAFPAQGRSDSCPCCQEDTE